MDSFRFGGKGGPGIFCSAFSALLAAGVTNRYGDIKAEKMH